MFISPYPLELSADERAELEAMSRSRTIAAGLAQRARVILGIADGEPYAELGTRLALSTTTLTRWRNGSTATGWQGCMMPRAVGAAIGCRRPWRRRFSR